MHKQIIVLTDWGHAQLICVACDASGISNICRFACNSMEHYLKHFKQRLKKLTERAGSNIKGSEAQLKPLEIQKTWASSC